MHRTFGLGCEIYGDDMKTAEEIFNESGKAGMACEFGYNADVISLPVAIELAEIYANQSKWISVEDRLPEDNKTQNILINGDRNSSHHIYYSAGYDIIYKKWYNPFGYEVEENVTHWQPLPNNQ